MPLILGTNSIKDTGYVVANSLRFNRGSSDSLTRTQSSSPTHDDKGTLSFWFKRSLLGVDQYVFSVFQDSNNRMQMNIKDDDQLKLIQKTGGSTVISLITNRVFRDVSAWYHVVVSIDTTQGTASNRIKIYINGVQETSFATETYPSQNENVFLTKGTAVSLGAYDSGSSDHTSAYFSEIVMVDGQQLDPTSFGEFDSDTPTVWKPIDVAGLTFGTNGYYLDFENASSLGADVSGNSNNFTVNNLTSVDQSTDTCTNNFSTLNPLDIPTANKPNTFSEGNLEITNSADENRTSFSSIGVQSGKWYFEAKFLSGEMKQYIGISKQETVDRIGASANSYGFAGENARKWNNNSYASYGTTASSGDIIMVAFDADNGAIWVGKNGTWFASATQSEIEAGTTTNAMYSSITIDDFFMMGFSMEDSNIQVNFGSPMYAISSGNSDANGYGNFEYAVPSGYYALNTKNLAEYG